MSVQATSDAARADPARNVAAALMRLAESWIDGQRTCDRLEQMRRQLDTLRQLHLRRLEQGERERLAGVGMSDRTMPETAP